MTMHAAVLPGYQPHPTTCRYFNCGADLGPVSCRLYKMAKWKSALNSGRAALEAHLERYNADFKGNHRPGCPYSGLPPAVHASCVGENDEGQSVDDQMNEFLQKQTDVLARRN